MPVNRDFMAGWIDDDGSGTTGEILEVGDFSVFVDAIDDALADVSGGGGGRPPRTRRPIRAAAAMRSSSTTSRRPTTRPI